ncbi:Uncharacterized protein PAE221_03649 [Pseudomonas aeruginosa]|nr:Uncharacterized protein PAE221_03649 [Pseudomonas aeruginosa]
MCGRACSASPAGGNPHGPPRSCPGRRNTPSADQPVSGTDPGIAGSRRPRGAQATGALRGPLPTSSVGRIAAASVNRDSSSSAQICDNSEYFSPRQWPELLPVLRDCGTLTAFEKPR